MSAEPDFSSALTEQAWMARNGLHDLLPWWSPDSDSMVDPLDDPETRRAMRRYIGARYRHLQTLRAGPVGGPLVQKNAAEETDE